MQATNTYTTTTANTDTDTTTTKKLNTMYATETCVIRHFYIWIEAQTNGKIAWNSSWNDIISVNVSLHFSIFPNLKMNEIYK